LDTSTAITKFPYGSINKYITTAERTYTTATDTSPISLSGTDTAKAINTTTTTSTTRTSLQLEAKNTNVSANGSCSLYLQSGTNNNANAPKLSCSNYNSLNYSYADLVVDSGISGGNLLGCRLETIQTAEYNQTWGYSNGNAKSSVYYYEDSGGEFRLDITASGISFKAGSISVPVERMLITAGEIATNVNISTSAGSGVLDRSIVNATTTGTTNLTYADAFRTTINTPTDTSRIFVLPNPSGTTGYWYGFCNKATTAGRTIAIQYPAGTTIFTIAVATNSGGGSFAKFAVMPSASAYFTSG
jgi:hypothetical protein